MLPHFIIIVDSIMGNMYMIKSKWCKFYYIINV